MTERTITERPPPAVAGELFIRNMRALWRCDPQLALRVDAVHDDDRLSLEPTRSGHWTAQAATPQDTACYLHSRYEPIREAERMADSVEIEDKYCFVISGMGLGYHVRALAERLQGEAFIICSEPSVALIATAFTCVDLSGAMASGRLVILTDDDKTRLHELLNPRNTLMMLGAQFVSHAPSMRVAGESHNRITKAIAEFVTFTRMSLVTLVSNSQITCRNIAMNLVHYVATPGIDMLRGRFAGDPAIVISAGPSLARNIDQLVALKGRAVLCAVQTALKPLKQRGIVPDFVTSLDFHEISQKYFQEVGDLSDTYLVAEPKATWHVIDGYPGPVSLLDSAWVRLLVGDELGARDGLKAGATVAHLAFYLAVYMGCDPIIFVGQDLAFTGHVFYVPGVEIHHAWRSELNRFNTIEHKEWDRIARNRPILSRVPGNDGTELYTDELLLTYLEQFEKDIAGVPRRIINATEGGARIRGTEVMTLRDATEAHCTKPIDPTRFAALERAQRRDRSGLGPAATELGKRIEELDEAVTVCNELLDLLAELEGLTDDPQRFNQRLIRVDELRNKIHQESRAYRIVNAFSQLAELRRYSADRRLSADDVGDTERARRQISRDIEFITGVRDGAAELRPILTTALERIVRSGESA